MQETFRHDSSFGASSSGKEYSSPLQVGRSPSCAHGIRSAHELRAFGIAAVKESGLEYTDKFMWHEYHVPYFKYLFRVSGIACRAPADTVKVFEIGLGIRDRTGASAVFWRALLG